MRSKQVASLIKVARPAPTAGLYVPMVKKYLEKARGRSGLYVWFQGAGWSFFTSIEV